MFYKGFICGWVGMAAIIMFLLWGMTPRLAGIEYGYEPGYGSGYEHRDC